MSGTSLPKCGLSGVGIGSHPTDLRVGSLARDSTSLVSGFGSAPDRFHGVFPPPALVCSAADKVSTRWLHISVNCLDVTFSTEPNLAFSLSGMLPQIAFLAQAAPFLRPSAVEAMFSHAG